LYRDWVPIPPGEPMAVYSRFLPEVHMVSKIIPGSRPRAELAALLAAALLFVASSASDLVLFRLGIPGAATILNDVAIGILGGAILLYGVAAVHERQSLARARERAVLLAELNHHLRGALSVMGRAIIADNRSERLRLFDEAGGQIDRLLYELVPTTDQADTPLYSVRPWERE